MSQPETTDAADGFAPDPKIAAQVAELRELEARYPEPPLEDSLREREWLYGMMAAEAKDPDWPYWNRCVAVYGRQIVGSGPDGLQLQIDAARRFGVHPGRVFVTYLGEW